VHGGGVTGPEARREIIWVPETGPGMEHLRLSVDAEHVVAGGRVFGSAEGTSYELHYEIRCDASWAAHRVHVQLLQPNAARNEITSDGQGRWVDERGQAIAALDGCVDVDLSVTPFTNTLPIRRLPWKPGQSRELDVAYVRLPEFQLSRARQRYTCLSRADDGARFLYESIPSGFRAEIVTDADGIVVSYPRFARRLWRL
jgi:hypothetical protein